MRRGEEGAGRHRLLGTWALPAATAVLFLALWGSFKVIGFELDDPLGLIPRDSDDRFVTAALVMLALAADVVAPVPNVPVMVFAGSIFGVPLGAALVTVGSMLSSTLAYLMGRHLPRRILVRLATEDQLASIGSWVRGHGRWALVLSRAMPIVPEAIAVAAGAARVPLATFLGWTLLGTVPISLVLVAAGSAVGTTENLLLVGAGAVLASTLIFHLFDARHHIESPRERRSLD